MAKNKDEQKIKEQAAETAEETVSEIVTPLELAEKKAEEYKNTLQRLQAEFENYKKRTSNDNKRMRLDGQDDVLSSLLLLADSFDLGMSALADQASEGFKLVCRQLRQVFEKYGVQEIEAKAGDEFNPDVHNAVLNEENAEQKGKILEVLMKGYKRDGRILRHSMVKVAI